MTDAFTISVERVLRFEGGLGDLSALGDKGGLTNWGISHAAYPTLDIARLTREQAIEIYRRDYWQRPGLDRLAGLGDGPARLAIVTMDYGVNSGVGVAVRALQVALQAGLTVDGVIGPATLAAAASCNPDAVLRRIAGLRLRMLAGLKTFSAFGAGWTRRVADGLLEV